MSNAGDPPVVVNEVVNKTETAAVAAAPNEIVVASRPGDLAVVPAGARVLNEVVTTQVFPNHGPGPMGFQLCSNCRRYWHTSLTDPFCHRCRFGFGYDRGDDRGCGGGGHGRCGYDRCSYCERFRIADGGVGCRGGGIGICRDRCGRPALCRPVPRRLAYEKKTVKRYYY
ncbi:hypothetical protein CDEST_11557 [Colletotrichum destructivum]|uniref:Uncharacterized protein n=1 Tax=Colletotrichum destructivum TaxID=34406 RepID=A0AAX4ITU2_9PEZI|nr:hypothetical protein CDEST_11557 [Colletotrichum destructivum]